MTVPRPHVPLMRVVSLAALLSLPWCAVLVVLAFQEMVVLGPAVIAACCGLVVTVLLLRPLAADWQLVTQYLRSDSPPQDEIPITSLLHFQHGSAAEVAMAARYTRLRARQQVVRAEIETSRQARLLHSLPDPLLLINRQRQIVRWNEAARTLFGREMSERPLTALVRDPSVLEAVDRVLEGEARQRLNLVVNGSVDRTFQVDIRRLSSLPGEASPGPLDKEALTLLTLHDITPLVRIEQMRADFVANASHELRTPLASVLGFIETLRGPARDDLDAHDRFLAIMHQQASRMKRLIEDLLSLSRIELHEHTPPSDLVDLGDVVRDVLDGLELQMADKEMPLQLAAPEQAALVIGDSDEVAQVVLNLLSNAVKYGRDGTPVRVQIAGPLQGPVQMPQSVRAHCYALHVTDQGEGIAKEHLPRLTERFYRVDTARSRQLGGTGLGLAIVKHIVNRHRGWLHIESDEGSGSTFTVYLPAAL